MRVVADVEPVPPGYSARQRPRPRVWRCSVCGCFFVRASRQDRVPVVCSSKDCLTTWRRRHGFGPALLTAPVRRAGR